jgi:hypothetical protein
MDRPPVSLSFLRASLPVLVLFLCTSAQSQTIPYLDVADSGGVWAWQPPADALDLLDANGAAVGKVWFQQWRQEILVLGNVETRPFEWARFPQEFSSRAHIDLWIRTSTEVPLPEIAWGSQFGMRGCDASLPPDEQANCAAWSARQSLYRGQLRRLFVRQWQFAPRVSVERFATEAHRQVLGFTDDRERIAFEPLEPTWLPGSSPHRGFALPALSPGGSFKITVPVSVLPPAASLELSSLYVAVEISQGGKITASTSPHLAADDSSTFKRLEFARPIVSRVSECAFPLTGSTLHEKEIPAWYFPSADGVVSTTFVLANDAVGYRYSPEGVSPLPFWTQHFSRTLGGGSMVCGPHLRFVAGGKTWDFDARLDESTVDSFQLPDGTWLVKSGPTVGTVSALGAGQCGSCPAIRMSVFRLDPQSGIVRAFETELVIPDPEMDGDIQIAADWQSIVVYRGALADDRETVVWTAERHCLAGNGYTPCGTSTSAPAEPRHSSYRRLLQ